MIRTTSDEVGRALYHLLKKSGNEVEQVQEEVPYIERRTQTQRAIRSLPDGTVEVIEHISTDERLY